MRPQSAPAVRSRRRVPSAKAVAVCAKRARPLSAVTADGLHRGNAYWARPSSAAAGAASHCNKDAIARNLHSTPSRHGSGLLASAARVDHLEQLALGCIQRAERISDKMRKMLQPFPQGFWVTRDGFIAKLTADALVLPNGTRQKMRVNLDQGYLEICPMTSSFADRFTNAQRARFVASELVWEDGDRWVEYVQFSAEGTNDRTSPHNPSQRYALDDSLPREPSTSPLSIPSPLTSNCSKTESKTYSKKCPGQEPSSIKPNQKQSSGSLLRLSLQESMHPQNAEMNFGQNENVPAQTEEQQSNDVGATMLYAKSEPAPVPKRSTGNTLHRTCVRFEGSLASDLKTAYKDVKPKCEWKLYGMDANQLHRLARELNMTVDGTRDAAEVFVQHDVWQVGFLSLDNFERAAVNVISQKSGTVDIDAVKLCCWKWWNSAGIDHIILEQFLEWVSRNRFNAELVQTQEQRDSQVLARKCGCAEKEVDDCKFFLEFSNSNSRQLDIEGFANALKGLLKMPGDDNLATGRLRFLWREIDTNNTGTASFEEFVRWWAKRKESLVPYHKFYRTIRCLRNCQPDPKIQSTSR